MQDDEDYVPDSDSESDSDASSVVVSSLSQSPLSMNTDSFHTGTKTTNETTDETTGEVKFTEDKAVDTGKNYCYVCQKPQFKLARHLEKHKTEVMEALSYPKGSVKRRRLQEKLRNRGNFQHNVKVLKSGTGQ